MKYKISPYTRYEKHLAEKNLTTLAKNKLIRATEYLADNGYLHGMFRDHKIYLSKKLRQRYHTDTLYEFHLEGNLLVIYFTDEEKKIVYLVDIGSHKSVLLKESYDPNLSPSTPNSPTRIKLFE